MRSVLVLKMKKIKMIKTFAIALAPIFALGANRGNGNGDSFENSIEVELIPNKLSLYIYNQWSGTTDEIHGDLSWTVETVESTKEPLADDQFNEYVEYGFCIRPDLTDADGDSIWDCMRARTGVNIKSAVKTDIDTWSSDFSISDRFYIGSAPKNLETYFLTTADAGSTEAWKVDSSKSSKTGCKAGTTDDNFWCANINVHFFRNWNTRTSVDWKKE